MGSIPRNSVVENCLRLLDVHRYRHPFADHGAKKLLTGPTITLLVEAQIAKRMTLWDIEENLRKTQDLQELVQLQSIHGATVYRKIETLPTDVLRELAMSIFERIHRHYSQCALSSKAGPLHIVDSTQIALPKVAGEWAYCSKDLNAVKVHVRLVMDAPGVTYPDKLVQSTAAVSDQTGALELVIDPDATYVLDRGYINYGHYYRWNEEGIRFVTRVKENSKLAIQNRRDVSGQERVDLDADVLVACKDGPTLRLRLVEYHDEQGRSYRVVTNRWDLDAAEVAQIYRWRWMIELFFKWMKQHLKLVKLYNHKPQAVWNQVWLAMIAYGLVELVKIQTGTKHTLWQILKRLRQYWLDSWDHFLACLTRRPSRTSKGRVQKKKRGRPRKYPKILKPAFIIAK